jgi:hypothetical protein
MRPKYAGLDGPPSFLLAIRIEGVEIGERGSIKIQHLHLSRRCVPAERHFGPHATRWVSPGAEHPEVTILLAVQALENHFHPPKHLSE